MGKHRETPDFTDQTPYIVLNKWGWQMLSAYMQDKMGLTLEQVQEIMQTIILLPENQTIVSGLHAEVRRATGFKALPHFTPEAETT